MAATAQRLGLIAFGLLDLVTLRFTWPHPTVVLTHLGRAHEWVNEVGVDGAALELTRLGLWVTAVWLAVGLLGALATALPGGGSAGASIARLALPKTLQRLAAGALGVSILVQPMLAQAATGQARAPRSGSSQVGVQAQPARSTAQTVRAPVVDWPSDPPSHGRIDVPWPHQTGPKATAAGAVTVRAGDSLWLIAAHRLPGHPTAADIAAAWPRWYHANASTIGANPNLISAGQQLHEPMKGPSS